MNIFGWLEFQFLLNLYLQRLYTILRVHNKSFQQVEFGDNSKVKSVAIVEGWKHNLWFLTLNTTCWW